MALKPWHKTRWNGHKQHKDELSIYRDMPFSSKRETTMFEIQTRDICREAACNTVAQQTQFSTL